MLYRWNREVALLFALGGCGQPPTISPNVATAASAINSGYVVMNVVAHEDDDILFMNPDLANFLGAGYGTVTMVLTAGEADGTTTDALEGCPAPAPYEGRFTFAHHRQDGMRAAYAQMAGMPDSWRRGVYTVNGREIEIDALDGATQVQLVFLNLPDDDDFIGGTSGCGDALSCLFDRAGDPSFPTLPPLITTPLSSNDPPVASDLGIPSYEMNRDFLISDLVALIRFYQPSVIRTLDPHPYKRTVPGGGYAVSYDGIPHTTTAAFLNEAVQQYAGPAGTGKFQTMYYRGYSLGNQRPNLGVTEQTRKADTFAAYTAEGENAYDKNVAHFVCAQQAAGDYTGYLGFVRGIAERYPGNVTGMTNLPDGRLAVFAVMGRQLAWWSEVTSGGSWTGPSFLGGAPLAPSVTTAARPSGDLVVVGLQVPDEQDHFSPPPDPHLAIVYNARSAASGAWSGWVSLGNPDDGSLSIDTCAARPFPEGLEDGDGRWLGTPAAAVDGGGNLIVAARDTCGHVSLRAEVGGVFQPNWTHLSVPVADGYDVIDSVAAITADDGRVHLFASTMQGWIAHWIQAAPGSNSFTAETAGFPVGTSRGVAGPPSVTKNQDGRLQVFWHGESTGDVMTEYERVGGGWSGIVDLGNTGTGGSGPIAAIRRSSGHIMLFARNGYDGISANWQGAVNSSFATSWTDLQGEVPAFQTAGCDGAGHAAVAVLSLEGELRIRRETTGVGGFGPWSTVGAITNLAAGATVTVSSAYQDSGWSAARAVDGSENSVPGGSMGFTSQLGIITDHTEWIALQLPARTTFSKIVLFPRNDRGNSGKGFPIDFKLQVWDGASWLDRVTRTNYPSPDGAGQVFSWGFSDTTDRIRVFATKLGTDGINGRLLQLAEIEVLP